MAIKSAYHLPSDIYSENKFRAELLPKVGTRSGMKCIYKVRMAGDANKRAGVYLSERKGDVFFLDVGGNKFIYNIKTNEIQYRANLNGKYASLASDPEFVKVLNLTLAHFGEITLEEGVYKAPPPKVTALSDEEADAIDGFGMF